MKKLKDAVIIPRKLLGEVLLTGEDENEIIRHLLRYGLELEASDPRYIRYEDILDRANTELEAESKGKNRLTDEEYEIIISHLNKRTGKRFRSSSSENRRWMDHPISAGYTVEDEIRVIDIMCDKWNGDSRMHQYLRPETLFGNKFAGYLNAESGSHTESSFDTESFFGAAFERAYGGMHER